LHAVQREAHAFHIEQLRELRVQHQTPPFGDASRRTHGGALSVAHATDDEVIRSPARYKTAAGLSLETIHRKGTTEPEISSQLSA
jgi:hypothetical protein